MLGLDAACVAKLLRLCLPPSADAAVAATGAGREHRQTAEEEDHRPSPAERVTAIDVEAAMAEVRNCATAMRGEKRATDKTAKRENVTSDNFEKAPMRRQAL